MVTNLSNNNSLVGEWVTELRSSDTQLDAMRFRRNMERIGEVCAYEISKTLSYATGTVATSLGVANTSYLAAQPVLATILRAGLPLHQGLLNYFDKAGCAFIGAYRSHHADGSFHIAQEYITSPGLDGSILIIADPMLATGASLALAIESLTASGKPLQIHVVCAIASRAGIEKIELQFPGIHIWAAAIDEKLTDHGYIVPGLGDAGDLSYGNKLEK